MKFPGDTLRSWEKAKQENPRTGQTGKMIGTYVFYIGG